MRTAALCLHLAILAPPANADPGPEPPRPLSARGLENLIAFTRLLGYVRHFHPSDQAAAADWDEMARAGVQAVERAAGPQELARLLEEVFRPVAPTVLVFPSGSAPPPLPAALARPDRPLEATAWEHHGYVGFMPGVYRSERVAGPPRKGLADPGQPFRADLGGGVSALVPLALYRDGQGTLPHVPARAPRAEDGPAGFAPSGDDRTTRLAAVALAWNVPQHFYPYFDVVRTDWPAALRRALESAATDRDERAFLDTLRRMLAALQDGHGMVVHRSDPWAAVLPLLWDWIEGRLVVTHVAPEGAGEVRRGDVVLRIDGRPAEEVVAAREELTSAATPRYRRTAALFQLYLGTPDSQVRVDVQHPSGETASVTLRRSIPFSGPFSLPEPRPERIAELRPGVLYVDLERMTDEDLEAALDRLAAAQGIVFDLRGHPNSLGNAFLAHLTDRPLAGLPYSIPVITRPDREGMVFEPGEPSILQPATPRLRARVAFLADARTISFAESGLLALVEHHRLGEIVGGPTAGTSGNFAPFLLPGGYRVFWTAMKVTRYDGSPFHGAGVRPTVPAARTLRGVLAGRDEILERALEVVTP